MSRYAARTMTMLAVLAWAVGVVPPAQAGDPEVVWPLDLPTRYLTSNFMEHRPGRFHAGLDFKTDERPGHPVRAVCDGWISRIRFTAGGYGKALYLRGDDGRTYVYAHLERLADFLRQPVEKAQKRRGRWDVALYFPAGRHAVRAGDVLALSGQSGTGGPHLHFEVRDRDNRPFDPQTAGFAVADTIAPVLSRVRLIPASADARVAGSLVSHAIGNGRTALPDDLGEIAVQGAVALTCKVVEVSDIRGHRLEPWRLALTLDDSLIFESRNEVYDFTRNDRARLQWLDTPGGRERWLHLRRGDDLAGREGGRWWADPDLMTPGRHELHLVAEDRAGNRAETSWTLVVGDGSGSGGWTEAPLDDPWDRPAEGVTRLTPFLATLADGSAIPADSLALVLDRPVAAVIDSLELESDEVTTMARAQGLEPLGGAVRVRAADWAVAGAITVSTSHTDSLPAGTGLYISTSRGWRLAGRPQRRESDTGAAPWTVDLSGPGRFALLRDLHPPYLGPGPEEGFVRGGGEAVDPAVSPTVWAIVPIRLEDMGSGVDAASIHAEWNGHDLIVEPDMPRRRVLVTPPGSAQAGPHTLLLRAADAAGNEIERTYSLRLVSEE